MDLRLGWNSKHKHCSENAPCVRSISRDPSLSKVHLEHEEQVHRHQQDLTRFSVESLYSVSLSLFPLGLRPPGRLLQRGSACPWQQSQRIW